MQVIASGGTCSRIQRVITANRELPGYLLKKPTPTPGGQEGKDILRTPKSKARSILRGSYKDDCDTNRAEMSVLLVLGTLLQVALSASERNFGHERVVQAIMDNYGEAQRLVRPDVNTSVSLGIVLHAIRSFDDRTGLLTGGYWLRESWKDARLAWEDKSVEHVRMPIEEIWRPDIRVWNADDKDEMVDTAAQPIIYADGSVLWVPPAEFNTRCQPPAEGSSAWTCLLRIGSWAQNSFEIELSFYGNDTKIDLMAYDKKLYGWDVTPLEGELSVKYYDCCPEPYTSANFVMTLTKIPGGVADVSNGAPKCGLSLATLLAVALVKLVL